MPKAPVLDRTAFYDTLKDGTIRFLDWNLINTKLGQMIEPAPLSIYSFGATRIVQIDERDASITRLLPFNEDQFYRTFFVGGPTYCRDINT